MKGVNMGRFIAQRRRYLGMTQQELAEKMNISKSAVAKWETDGGVPNRDNLKILADTLRVSVDCMYRIMDESRNNEIQKEGNKRK